MATCEHCGKSFEAKRVTAKYCSDRCRVRAHRWKDYSVKQPLLQVMDLIRTIGAATEGDLSFEAVMALKSIQKAAAFQDISSKSSWWRCSNCWQAIQKEIPQDNDCSCGKTENAHWKLQKKMM